MNTDEKALKERGDQLFAAKKPYDSRNQDIADNFYVERADFTVVRDIGDNYADHLVSGYPSMVRNSLGNSFGSMLRPKGQPWFHMGTEDDELGLDSRQWLEWATSLQRRAMYDRVTHFTRATKEADHDFATFGGAVISTELNQRDNALLYRCWHLRDVAWDDDSYGQSLSTHRNWKPTVSELIKLFGDNVHQRVKQAHSKEPYKAIDVRHVMVRSDEFGDQERFPWKSVYIDCENNHVMLNKDSWTPVYTIPKWATVSGSQYPYSPASVIALPDARMLQAMTLTLLDAGERAANPPMIGVAEAIRSDMNIYPGGFTAIDAEYDERLGEVLRPLTHDKSGLPFGVDMTERTAEMIREAFYLNTLQMPQAGGADMTAYEVGQRVQEYIRNALPLFEPMEAAYNEALCEITFETLMRGGAFGSPDSIPEEIQGADVQFQFESPLSTMIERQKGQQFMEAKAIAAESAAIDPSVVNIIDVNEATRDVLTGIGTPAKWMRSKEDVEAKAEADKEAQDTSALLEQMQQGADVANTLSQAAGGLGGA